MHQVLSYASNTLNDMIDVFRLEKDTFEPIRECIDLDLACQHAVALIGPSVSSAVKVSADNSTKNGKLVVISDSTLLMQLLTNLLANASKHVAAGHIRIICKPVYEADDFVTVILGVADTGSGFTKSVKPRSGVEERSNDRTALAKSEFGVVTKPTGLGLHLANIIARVLGAVESPVAQLPEEEGSWVHGTHLHISSPLPDSLASVITGDGPGTFVFTKLRFEKAEEWASIVDFSRGRTPSVFPDSRPTQGAFTFNPQGTLRVLAADDQKTVRQLDVMLLKNLCEKWPSMNVQFDTALSGEDAVRQARLHNYHLIMLDESFSEGYCNGIREYQTMIRQTLDRGGGDELTEIERTEPLIPPIPLKIE